ncbi:MAG TPA: autotransporter-associated beta strand repeat-containing protein, partial [Humisphaera sp.]
AATNDLSGTFQLNGLLLNHTGTGLLTLGGNPLNFTADGASNNPVLNQAGTAPVRVLEALTATDALTIGGTGSGPLLLDGSTLALAAGLTVNNAGFDVTIGNLTAVTGAGALTKTGSGTLRLNGTNTTTAWTGAINLQGGTTELIGTGTSDPAALGLGAKTVTITNNATLRLLGAGYDPAASTKGFTIGSGGGTFDVGTVATFTTNDASQFAGAGTVTKTGLGVWTVGTASVGYTGFTGSVVINQGVTRVLNVNSLGSAPAITIGSGGTLDVQVASFNAGGGITATGAGFGGGGAIVSNTTAGSTAGAITAATGLTVGGTTNLGLSGAIAVAAGGITKVGTNVVTYTVPASATSVTGASAIRGGTLALNFGALAAPVNVFDPAQPLSFANTGSLTVTGSSAAATNVTVGGTQVGAGFGTVTVTPGAGQTASLNLGTIAPASGTAFRGGLSFAGTGSVVVANANTAGGILGGWATFGTNNWAVGGAAVAALGSYSANTYAANTNTDVTAAYPVAAPAGFTTHSLRFNTAPAASPGNTFTMSGTNVVETGGILVGTGVATNALSITGGNLVTPSGAAQPNLFVHQNGGVDVVVTSVIGVSGNVGFGVVKTGSGRLTLNATNLFTGGVFLDGGTLRGIAAGSFGPAGGVVTFGGGSTLELRLDAATTYTTGVNAAGTVVAPGAVTATIDVNRNTSTSATGIVATLNGAVTLGDGQLQTTGGNTYGVSLTGVTTLAGSPTLNTNTAPLTLGQVVGNGFGIVKAGASSLSLNTATSTFTGGLVATAGVVRLGANSTVTGGAITQGPVGTGTLTAAGAAFNDGDAARTIHNKLVVTANTTFQNSTAASAGTFTFTSAGLTTANTIDLQAANPVLTVANVTTFASTVTGMSFTKSGTGTLVLSGDNRLGWSGTATVNGGVLQFGSINAIGGTGRNVVAASGGAAATGYAIDQTFLDRLAVASAGVASTTADTANPLDFSAFTGGLRLGASGATPVNVTGPLNFGAGNNYRFGGGGNATSPVVASLLNVGTQLSGAVAVDVGLGGTAAGDVSLTNPANTFTGAGGFNLIVGTGAALRLTLADGAPGAASSYLGAVPAAATNNVQLAGGALRFVNATASLAATRTINLATGGGTLDTFGSMVAPAFTGTGGLTKSGGGILTLSSALPAGNALTINPGTSSANTGVDANGTALTLASLTMNGVSASTTLVASLTNFSSLAVNGPVSLGTNSRATVAVNAGGALSFAAGTGSVVIGNNAGALAASTTYQTTVDASLAASATVTGAGITLGATTGATNNGEARGVLLLPTAATATSTVAATGTILVGASANNGGTTGRIALGGGAVTLTAATLQAGDQKTGGFVAFNDGTTYTPGGRLSLAGVSGGRVAVTLANNTAGATGTTSQSALDTTGGTLTGPGGTALIGTLTLGGYARGTGATAVTGNGTGVFVIDGAASAADISAVSIAPVSGTAPYTAAGVRGTFVVNNGTAVLGGAITNASAGSTSNVWVFGGTLNMAGNAVGGANGIGDLGLAGGTLLNAGAVTAAAAGSFNHSGGTLARTAAGTTALTGGAYNLGAVAPNTAVFGGQAYGAPAVGGSTVRLDATGGGAARAVTAPSLVRTAGGTLNVVPVSGGLGANETVTFATTPATIVTSTVNMVPAYVVAQASGANRNGDFLTHGASGLVPMTYAAATDLNAATNADVFNATAPQTLTAAAAVLALRAAAPVDLGGATLTVGAGANPAGVIVNGVTISNGTLAFGANEGVLYAGGSAAGAVSAAIAGTGGLTVFGAGSLTLSSANPGLSGAVRVNGGTLTLDNATGSATGTGAVTVGSGGRLAGGDPSAAGSFAGTRGFSAAALVVNRFGVLSPGKAGVGTLTTGAATLAGGSIVEVDINAALLAARAGAAPADVNVNDRVAVTGALTLTGATNFNPITLAVDGGGGSYTDPNGYDFYFANATSVAGFSAAAFTVQPTNFGTGPLTYSVSQVGNNLVLT